MSSLSKIPTFHRSGFLSFYNRLRAAIFVANRTHMASLVEEHFIRETLEAAAVHIYKDQTEAIQQAVSSASTGHLLRNRFFNVGDTTIEHRHPVYERFLDMKKLQRNGKVVKRTPQHIHNRFMWGLYLRIQDRLMYGLTEDVRQRIRTSLGLDEQQNTTQK